MIINDYNKEVRRISDTLRDLGYSDSTRQKRKTLRV